MRLNRKLLLAGSAAACVALVAYYLSSGAGAAATSGEPQAGARVDAKGGSVDITEQQQKYVSVVDVVTHRFEITRTAPGYLDFNQERLTPVSSPYQGRIIEATAHAGEDVARGRTLFTLESPDLVQAESTLIAAAGAYEMSKKTLERAQTLYPVQGVPQKELEGAVSEEQGAAAALHAARDAVRIFGKSEADMDRMIAERRVDPQMVVASPISGRIVARNAAPGMLVQPGASPAPYVIGDVSSLWIEAAIAETDVPLIRVGQTVVASIEAFPGRRFEARVSNVGESLDAATRRVLVRADIADPHHELRPQMQATLVIHTGEATTAPAVPQAGVVREGDGTMSVWVTRDARHFERRTVKVGQSVEGLDEIVSGLNAGERVAGDGALFLSNALTLANP
jgi:cobalt-zinc-cadmium efflux system membrane fusion protein